MLADILSPLLQRAGKAVVSISVSAGKTIVSHLSKHGSKYVIGVFGAAGTVVAYDKGKSKGKKQGTVEQAQRDKAKMQDMHKKHEKDRENWRETDKKKDKLINELLKEFKFPKLV